MSRYFECKLSRILEGAAPMAPPKPVRTPPKPRPAPTPSPINPPKPQRKVQPKNAAPMAPPRPAPPRPAVKPSPSPFNPTKPGVRTAPKNFQTSCVTAMIAEALSDDDYEREAHPTTRDFWKTLPNNKKHQFSSHPLLALFGKDLSRDSWKHTRERAGNIGVDMNSLMPILQEIMQEESKHTDELINLAKQVTVQIWGIPAEQLEAQLTDQVDQNQHTDDEYGEEQSIKQDDQKLQKQINKRITMNLMTHGSAVHQMLTMHHVVDREINAISPKLLALYNKFSAGSHALYWLINIPQMFDHLGATACGSEDVVYSDDGEPAKVVAKALVFPVLCQELSKGVAEMISHHGLGDVSDQSVIDKADDIRHEPYMIQVGPEIWRRFNAVRPKNIPLANIMMALAQQDDPTAILIAVIKDPDSPATKEMLDSLIQDPEGFDEIDEFDDDDDGGEDLNVDDLSPYQDGDDDAWKNA